MYIVVTSIANKLTSLEILYTLKSLRTKSLL